MHVVHVQRQDQQNIHSRDELENLIGEDALTSICAKLCLTPDGFDAYVASNDVFLFIDQTEWLCTRTMEAMGRRFAVQVESQPGVLFTPRFLDCVESFAKNCGCQVVQAEVPLSTDTQAMIEHLPPDYFVAFYRLDSVRSSSWNQDFSTDPIKLEPLGKDASVFRSMFPEVSFLTNVQNPGPVTTSHASIYEMMKTTQAYASMTNSGYAFGFVLPDEECPSFCLATEAPKTSTRGGPGPIFVSPAERGKGVAAALLSHRLASYSAACTTCCAVVAVTNFPSLSLFLEHGFRIAALIINKEI